MESRPSPEKERQRVSRRVAYALVFLGLAILTAIAAAAKKPPKDDIWIHPDFPSLGVVKVGVLPVASYDGNVDAQKTVEIAFGQAFRGARYHWVSPGSSLDYLRAAAGGKDSLLEVVRKGVLKSGRVDSLVAPGVCAALHSRAVLSMRVDQWDRVQLEPFQSGKPSTQVKLTAALVDSLGRLVWRVSGIERGEGSYQEANAGAAGMSSSGIENKPVTANAGAPPFPEVLAPLFARWAAVLPAPPADAPASGAAPAAPDSARK